MATRLERLGRLHDGELEPHEAERFRAQLTDEDEQQLAALREVDEVLVNTLTEEAASAKLDLWASIESKLPEETAAPVEPAAQRPHQPESGHGKVLPFLRRRAVRVTAILSSLAAAAGLMLLLRSHPVQTNRCDIEELDVAGQSATVIAVPDEHGQETALIWFDHQETDEWESL